MAAVPTDRDIGVLVRRARRAAAMTQRDVAVHVGVTQGEVARWESGARGVTLRMAIALADAMRVEVDDLVPTSDR